MGDTLDTVHKVGTTLVSIAVIAFALYEKVKKPSSPATSVSVTLPGAPALGAGYDPETLALLRKEIANVAAAVAAVAASVAHEASRTDVIEAARKTEREEHREDSREDREARERLSTSLASLHGKLDHAMRGK